VFGSVELASASASVEKAMGDMGMGGEGGGGGEEKGNTHSHRGDSVGVLPLSSPALLSAPLSVGSSGGSLEKHVGFQTDVVKVEIDAQGKESK
jgi:hypothetical protein